MFYCTQGDNLIRIELKAVLKPFPTTNELVNLTIVHDSQVFSATLSSIQFRQQFDASQSNMTLDIFIDHIWKGLLKKTEKHGCKITLNGSVLEVQVNFQVAEGILLTLGRFTLEKDTIPSISIIKEMTENIIKLQQENENLETQIKKLKAGRDHVLQKYEAFEREKSLADTDIFQKFVQVLNEKKRKIKELSQ